MTIAPPRTELERLTRRVARLQYLTAATLALTLATVTIVAALVARDPTRDRIETREIAVRDVAGATRAKLNATGISLYDDAGKERLQALLADGTATLVLYGGNQHRIALAAAEDGRLGMYFFDNTVRDRARLSLDADAGVGFTLFDDRYIWRATMAVTAANQPSLTIFDERGHVVVKLPPDANAVTVPP